MSKAGKSRKPLIIGIVAAVVILAALLALLLTQCIGGQGEATVPTTTAPSDEVPSYQLYWNLDRAEYDGKSEAGMSSRMPEADGYFHVRFFCEGEELTLKVADRKLINSIDVQSLMGLELDEEGIVVGVLSLDDMPLEKVGWQFYVQSAARTMIKLNSSESLNGMEVLLEKIDPNRVWDMSGKSGPLGTVDEAIEYDKIMAVQNLAGEVTHVFIFERPNYMLSHEGYCEHCKETVMWSEWIKDTTMPMNSGHYQLQNDIQLKTQASLPEDVKLCLDLNGYRIDGNQNGGRAISMHNPAITLAIMDTSEEQTGVIACHEKVDQGGCVWVRYGALYLYSGTLDASDAYGQKGGIAVDCGKEKFFYMFGGEIIGGRATYTYNAEKNTYGAGSGGAVTIGGKFVMHDGVIRDGHAEAAVIYKNGKIDSYQRGSGGNLYLSGTSEFEMNGGTIKNGMAGSAGGNIFVDGTTEVTINGGTISGGLVYGKGKNGGSIHIGSKATFTLNSGSIYGGTCYNAGGNVYLNGVLNINGGYIGGGQVYNFTTRKLNAASNSANLFVVNGRVNMGGGVVAGHFAVTDSKKGDNKQPVINLYGVARVDGSKENVNLTVSNSNDGTKVLVNYLYKGAKIGVTTTIGIFTEPTKAEYKQYFYSDIEGADIHHYNGRLALGRLNCLCGKSHGDVVSDAHINGCKGEVLLWTPWTSNNSLPTADGNVFLTKDVTMTKQTVLPKGKVLQLDLNGKNITFNVQPTAYDGFRLYRAEFGAKLSVTDTTDNPGTLRTFMPGEDAVYPGKTVKTKAVKDEDGNVISEAVYYTEEEMRKLWAGANFGMLFWARGGEINLHNGILDGSHLSGNKEGFLVQIGDAAETDAETGAKTNYDGSFNMYGGTIIGGYTKSNGNICVGANTEMNLYGGTITGGRANLGGNIAIYGTFNMYGGTVTKGLVDRSEENVDGGLGGNIAIASKDSILGTMNMYGGVISDGVVKAGQKGGGHGGNIIVYGYLNAKGGIITGGDATSAGGNIASIATGSVITLDGVHVLDGVGNVGGNVAIHVRTNKGLYLLGDTVISGGHARSTKDYGGGNIAVTVHLNTVDQDQIVVIDGATIKDGTAAYAGGNICIRNTTANRFVTDEKTGKEKQDRYQISVDVTMKSGTISGGINGYNEDGTRTKANGGSIYSTNKATFTVEGGTISGGDCADIGGNIYTNGLLTIKGGTIKGGTGKGKQTGSGNISVVNGTLAVSGGVIEGDVSITATKTGAAKVQLSGKPVINKNVGGLKLSPYESAKAPVIEIDGILDEGASVFVNGSGYISTETSAENIKFFNSETDAIILYNKCMFIGQSYCLCGKSHDDVVSDVHINGCDGTVYGWERWTSTNTLPVAVKGSTGNYYLAEDVITTAQQTVQKDNHIRLNLNGHNVTLQVQTNSRDAWRLYRTDDSSTLAITDTTENPGTLKTVMPDADAKYTGGNFKVGDKTYVASSEEAQAYVKQLWANGNFGMIFWARGGKITVHNAIIDASNLTGNQSGQAINVSNLSAAYCAVEDCEVDNHLGNFTFYNGEIRLGETTGNGTIQVTNAGASINIYGGLISGGKGNLGGGFYVGAGSDLFLDGATIQGGVGKYGGNIFSNGNVTIKNSTITAGVANGKGGNIRMQGTKQGDTLIGNLVIENSVISDGVIESNLAESVSGANLYLENANVTISGSTIENGVTHGSDTTTEASNGTVSYYHAQTGNIHALRCDMLITDTTIADGVAESGNQSKAYSYGGNFYIEYGTTKLVNSTVTGGHATTAYTKNTWHPAGSIFIGRGTLILEDTIVTGGKGSGSASNIYMNAVAGTRVELKGTTQIINNVSGGTSNICVGGGELIIEDGVQIINESGITARNIHAIAELDTTITINGGTISGGYYTAGGGNIYLEYSDSNAKRQHAIALDINGGTITGGHSNNIGGNLYFHQNAVVTMNGDAVITDGTTNTQGGNVGFVNGVMTLSGNANITNGTSYEAGANVFIGTTTVVDGGILSLSDNASITGGNNGIKPDGTKNATKQNGGSIHAKGKTQIILEDNASITGGNATNAGGNIYANGLLQLSENASITGGMVNGSQTSGSSNAFIVNGTLNMDNGFIDGGVGVTTSSTPVAQAILSGAPKITKNAGGAGLSLSGQPLVKAEGTRYPFPYIQAPEVLDDGAEIWLSIGNSMEDMVISEVIPEENYKFFHSARDAMNLYYVDSAMASAQGADAVDVIYRTTGLTGQEGKLYIGKYACLCGSETTDHLGECTGDKVVWRAWTALNTSSGYYDAKTNALPEVSGNWYLVGNVKVADQDGKIYIRNDSNEYRINVDLNGYDIQAATWRMCDFMGSSNIYLNFVNTKEAGKIYTSAMTTDQGALVWSGKQTGFYNVLVDASKVTLNKTKPHLAGPIFSGANLGLYGTTKLIGADSIRGQAAVEVTGTLKMDPTVVVEGEIFIGNSGKINMTGITDASMYTVNASGAFTTGNTITDSAKFFKSNTEAQIFLDGAEQFAGHKYCICGGADGKHLQYKNAAGETVGCDGTVLNWRPSRSFSDYPTGTGNWYLANDVEFVTNADRKFNANGLRYNLNLNGHTINFAPADGKGYRAFRVVDQDNIIINITDFSMETGKAFTPDKSGKVVAKVTTGGQDGTIFWLTKAGQQLNIYGGTFDASTVVMASGKAGTVLRNNNATANIYGGTLIGGVAQNNGGTISLGVGSKLNLYGGTVRGGSTAVETGYNGGNILVDDNAVMNMYGGLVTGGKTTGKTQTNGSIWDGYGGNIYVVGTLNMYGGEIRDGQGNNGDNINVRSRNANQDGTLNIYGGKIAGGITFDQRNTTTNGVTSVGKVKITIAGAPVIDKALTSADAAKKPAYSLNLPSNVVVDASGLTGGDIKVYANGKFGVAATANAEIAKAAFTSENGDEIVLINGVELAIGRSYCLCGASKTGTAHTYWCDGMHGWIAYTGGNFTSSGYYYLTGEITTNQMIVLEGKVGSVVVDLNGFAWNGNARAVRLDTTGDYLGITDTVGTGKLTGAFNSTTDHSGIILMGTGTVDLFAGTLEHRGDVKVNMGGIVAVPANGVVNIYDAVLTGGNANKGGNLYVRTNGTVNLYTGTITNGTATEGGNVYVEKDGKFNIVEVSAGSGISEGENSSSSSSGSAKAPVVSNGVATYGGNIYVVGEANIETGSVTKGQAVNGGNIYVNEGTVNVSGASTVIKDGHGKFGSNYGRGGNFYMVTGEINLTDGAVVKGGHVSSKDNGWAPGGNAYIDAGVLNVTNATIKDGQTGEDVQTTGSIDGNNLYINYGATVNLYAGAKVENTANFRHNILIQGGTLNLKGGVIANAASAAAANNIRTNSSWQNNHPTDSSKWPVINIQSGEIYGGAVNIYMDGGTTVNQSGGSVYVTGKGRNVLMNDRVVKNVDGTDIIGDAIYNMTGGAIYGGNAEGNGGNVFMYKYAKFNMTAGSVYNGVASSSGGNFMLSGAGASLTMGGTAKVYDGKNTGSGKNGGSIFVSSGTSVTMEGNAEVYGGETANGGGNFYSNGTITIKDSAKIYNPKENNNSANIFNVGGALDIQGGTISGGVRVHSGTIKVSGAPVIDKSLNTNGKNVESSLSLNNVVIDATGLTGGTIYVTAEDNTAKIAENASTATLLDVIRSEMKFGDSVIPTDWVESEDAIYLGRAEDKYCLCGASRNGNTYTCHCDGTTRVWVQWTDKTKLPTATGNYYLAYGVELTADTVATPNDKAKIVIDLRGNEIKLDIDERLYNSKNGQTASVILTDSAATAGAVTVNEGSSSVDGRILAFGEGTTFEMYRVTLDASKVTGLSKSSNDFMQGAAIFLNNTSMVMHSGTIKGGNSIEAGAILLYNGATFTMNGGTIEGGKASAGNGGNVAVGSKCSFTMNGGEIKGGSALEATSGRLGGNVYITGENAQFIMNGGTISGGRANNGGNVYVKGKANFTMNGGTISGGLSYGSGGNVSVNDEGSSFIMNGGTISGGSADGAGNIVVQSKSTFTMNGGTVEGGNSYVTNPASTSTGNGGGNIRVLSGATLTMIDGTIKGGIYKEKTTDNTCNVYVQNATFEMSGGEVWGGVQLHYYDGASLKQDAILKLSGAPVIDGSLNGSDVKMNGVSFVGTGENAQKNYIEVVGDLGANAKVYINRTDSVFGITNGKAVNGAFVANNSAQNVYVITQELIDSCDNETFTAADIGKLYIGQIHCVCGGLMADHGAGNTICDGVVHVWTSMRSDLTKSLVYSNGSNTSYYWYLTGNTTFKAETSLIADAATKSIDNMHLWIDTNGFNVTSTASRILVARSSNSGVLKNSSVNLVNTKSTKSTITFSGTRDQGICIWVSGGATARVFNVTLNGKAVTNTKNHTGGMFSIGGSGSYAYIHSVDYVGGATGYAQGEFLYGTTSSTIVNTTISGAKSGSALCLTGHAMTLDNVSVTGSAAMGMKLNRGTLTLKGNTTITGNTQNVFVTNAISSGSSLYGYVVLDNFTGSFGISANKTVTKDSSDKVTVYSDEDRALITSITDWATFDSFAGKITADDSAQQFALFKGDAQGKTGFGLTSTENLVQCACGGKAAGVGDHKCEKIIFKPWTAIDSLPVTPGNYYLTEDVACASASFKTAGVINIDLHDHNVTLGASRGLTTLITGDTTWAFTLGITNTGTTEKKGIISNESATSEDGGMLWMTSSNHVLNLYAGTLDASKITTKSNKDTAGIKVARGKVYMYGGEIIGGTVTYTTNGGGAVTLNNDATFDMYGGTIIGGKATSGGSVFMSGSAIFTLHDGTIKNGMATNGGNVQINSGCKLVVEDGTITGGHDKINTNGKPNTGRTNGNVNVNGELEVTGGTITGAVQLNGTGTMKVSGKVSIIGNNGITVCKDGQLSVGALHADTKLELFVSVENYFKTTNWPEANSIYAVAIDGATLDLNNFKLNAYKSANVTEEQKKVNFEFQVQEGKLILVEKAANP